MSASWVALVPVGVEAASELPPSVLVDEVERQARLASKSTEPVTIRWAFQLSARAAVAPVDPPAARQVLPPPWPPWCVHWQPEHEPVPRDAVAIYALVEARA